MPPRLLTCPFQQITPLTCTPLSGKEGKKHFFAHRTAARWMFQSGRKLDTVVRGDPRRAAVSGMLEVHVWSEQPQQAKSPQNQMSRPVLAFRLRASELLNFACFISMLYLCMTHCLSHLAVGLNWKSISPLFPPKKGKQEASKFIPFRLYSV